ncbi:MAG: hypothetical protein K0S24_2048 [Sphingobacterium sp.]|nr:hypothetical protein [Sphingobacterium sp.]
MDCNKATLFAFYFVLITFNLEVFDDSDDAISPT